MSGYALGRDMAPSDRPLLEGLGRVSLSHSLSGGGYLKQGGYVDAGNVTNNRVLNTLISSAIQDTASTMEDFGEGTPGQLSTLLA